ncbi:ubiquitin--protein ligase [Dictyocaulus viviparus]|uniref:Ubiquitin--protein ligase n=1 Tax=Dictyocaulus viviparus TaxID=29172 RepID=A0A0D8XQS7_DICVI|nr:ubiquitin--protein ligase [Dictyocaulus viviparus]
MIVMRRRLPHLDKVKRTIRRKLGVLSPSRTLKSDGVGMEERSKVIQRLLNEARFLRRNALPYCFLSPRSDNVFQWTAVLEGPHGTVYEGGTFFCNIHFTMSYPEMPPKVEFLTRIYHCNVNAQGEVSIDILNTKWKPSMSICTVRSALMSLFYSCNPDEALVASIGKEYRENRDEFDRMARIWTLRYAV